MFSNEDRNLLELISQNSRLTPDELAIQTGLSKEYIEGRIQQWVDDRVLVYRPLVNWERTGAPDVSALIEVKVLPQRGFGFDKIAKRLQKYPEIKAVYLMSGGFDLTLMIEGKTMQEVALFVSEKLAPLEHIQSTATHFVLRRYKQDGVELMGEEEALARLVVSP
ncbi:Lrp/AsnC family transcriptional regulator [Desulfitobacterium metallireducens]|uniref:AsnC family transcriptional regulator n=1 Tax=Desulfitobacterium metallireducens DSM 15288 TaxID=871968 RepID=W0EAI2_9FIRM|nr:Lrp/AsnC family transcriptional regulator [Desulfitobacterium metallireducens]AHF06543.1 AsnC family transcriptional regulator [Desulfitobacterium metallireducens DSM 15288]